MVVELLRLWQELRLGELLPRSVSSWLGEQYGSCEGGGHLLQLAASIEHPARHGSNWCPGKTNNFLGFAALAFRLETSKPRTTSLFSRPVHLPCGTAGARSNLSYFGGTSNLDLGCKPPTPSHLLLRFAGPLEQPKQLIHCHPSVCLSVCAFLSPSDLTPLCLCPSVTAPELGE